MSHNSGNARRILLDGVFNCRDLGGYPCAGGKTTQFGRFIRCGIPFGPMGPDRARLAEIPVKTVIDLRGNGESKVAPSAYAKEPDIVYHHYTLLEINPAYVEKVESQPLWESYVCSLTEHKENMAQVFHAIAAAPEGAVLFHCALGKDPHRDRCGDAPLSGGGRPPGYHCGLPNFQHISSAHVPDDGRGWQRYF